jgi:ADP-heptose:LPS heptosyltransferase
LVYRALGLGDFLAGVPALRMLRTALPDHRLVLAAPAPLAPLVDLCGVVDLQLPTAELASPAWHGQPPDVAVDLHGNGPASKRLLQPLTPRRLVAFAGPGGDGAHVPGPRWVADEHEVVRWCRLVEEAFGEPSRPHDLLLAPPDVPSPAPGAVVIHPGAASGSRRWPPERFAEVARCLAAEGADVVVSGSERETGLADDVRRRAGLPPESVLAGRTDLAALAALVASASLLVSGDTGIAHLATAFATPSVVLFGPVSPGLWGPARPGPHTVLWHGDGRGDPHGLAVDPALLRIGVDEVVVAAQARLVGQPRTAQRG